jgi:hypothetical protein
MHGRFMDKFRSKNTPPPGQKPTHRIARSTDWYVKVHDMQLEQLLKINPRATQLFLILLRESLRHHGKPFILPSEGLATTPGLSRRQLPRLLLQLERVGLILITHRPRSPPLIRVPMAL